MTETTDIVTISIIIPAYNEEDNIAELANKITTLFANDNHFRVDEIIFIDDGSSDQTWNKIQEAQQKHPQFIKGVRFRVNQGKSVALAVGFQKAIGDIVMTLDADLQDDPSMIPVFAEKIDEGFDVICGWRKNRKDPLEKRLPSKFFNLVVRSIAAMPVHDFNIGFKAYRKEVIKNLQIYGEQHRFIPILAEQLGYTVSEIVVTHHERIHGKSKFGLERYISGFLDLLNIILFTRFNGRPSHLFGTIGIVSSLIGGSGLGYLLIQWLLGNRPIGDRPLLLISVMIFILGVQFISTGLLSELIFKQTTRHNYAQIVSDTL